MSLFRLALANLKGSPLSSAVNVLLLALGTASIAILLLASAQLSSTLTRNAAGIDLVVGAKGSPLQLVLAGVYHADVPPGNIPLEELEKLRDHPMVESAIPLSLGDSFAGFRIVGTERAFTEFYDAELEAGEYWDSPLQAVIGSRVAEASGLTVGDTFVGVHGLSDDGHLHEESRYKIVGLFAPTDSVLDGLILTSLESVWLMHGSHDHHDHDAEHDQDEHDHDEHDHEEHDHEEQGHEEQGHEEQGHEDHDHDHDAHGHDEDSHEEHSQDEEAAEHQHTEVLGDDITLMLIKLSSPLGVLSLPREINEETALQAAAPAFEVARLLQIVGVGLDWLNAFAGILIVSAALSIFAALYSSLRTRRHALAVMRCLGASRGELFYLLFVEGLILTISGILLGLLFAHGGIELVGQWLNVGQGIAISGWTWAPGETLLVAGLLAIGSITALFPAMQAYGTDVPRTLSTL